MVNRFLWLILAVGVAGSSTGRRDLDSVKVEVKKLPAGRIQVDGEAVTDQSPHLIWKLLSGYDRLSEWVPGLTECRTVQMRPRHLILQRGATQLWLFKINFTVTFEVEEVPEKTIHFDAVSGDFLEHRGSWRLQSKGGRVRIRYEATIHPKFFVPPVIGPWLLESQLRQSLEALLEEARKQESVSKTF